MKLDNQNILGQIGKGALLPGILFLTTSCNDFITVPPPDTELVQENVFQEDATAIAAISGIYNKMSNTSSVASGGSSSLTLYTGYYSDELVSYSTTNSSSAVTQYYFNTVVPANTILSSTWASFYNWIYAANRMIEGLPEATRLSLKVKTQLLGEALFIRAFCHFYLTNLFGDVPLVVTSDYRVNSSISRTPSSEVYQQITADLLQAKERFTNAYPSAGRVRPNRSAATALLARAYLYMDDFENAEIQASEIIENSAQYSLEDIEKVFLATSEEAIWQLLPNGGKNDFTFEGALFILVAPPTGCALSNRVNAAFETNDLRKDNWVGSISSPSGLTTWYFPYKYKERQTNATGAEYSMVLRLAEQYLIRAEARTHLNKLPEAKSDIDAIRVRAGLTNTNASTKEELLAAIMSERRVELFAEWGHRFFDLKRTGRLDAAMAPVKNNWSSFNALLPLPESELRINRNLTQNFGY